MKSWSQKYPRQIRIRKRNEFLALYEGGKRLHSAHFTLFFRKAEAQRFGLAVSRKAGNAVQRNRVKRLLREFFRLHRQELPMMEFLAAAKKGAGGARLNLAAVESELLPLLRRLA